MVGYFILLLYVVVVEQEHLMKAFQRILGKQDWKEHVFSRLASELDYRIIDLTIDVQSGLKTTWGKELVRTEVR